MTECVRRSAVKREGWENQFILLMFQMSSRNGLNSLPSPADSAMRVACDRVATIAAPPLRLHLKVYQLLRVSTAPLEELEK